jgi:hypothetical protein
MDPSSRAEAPVCTICLENVSSTPSCREEEQRRLDCSHIFHRECIGEWLKERHNCPVCRAHVDNVGTPEAPAREMTLEEILAVPDVLPSSVPATRPQPIDPVLHGIRANIQRVRRIRQLNLNENSHPAETARKVSSVAGRIFGW